MRIFILIFSMILMSGVSFCDDLSINFGDMKVKMNDNSGDNESLSVKAKKHRVKKRKNSENMNMNFKDMNMNMSENEDDKEKMNIKAKKHRVKKRKNDDMQINLKDNEGEDDNINMNSGDMKINMN